jgi:hypothetical protein
MTRPETAWQPGPATPQEDESQLGMFGFGAAADRTEQLYPPASPGYQGWSPAPGYGADREPWSATSRPPAAPHRTRRIRLIALGAVVVVLAAAVAVLLTRHSGGPGPAGTGSGSSAGPSIDNVQTDPTPITAAEIFPAATVTASGFTLSQVAQSMDTNCSQAAQGAFASALTGANCERVLRVTFVTLNKHYVVTAGVAALPTLAAAHQAASAEDFGSDSWFTGLNGPSDSGAGHVNSTPAYAYQTILGRYIIFALATTGHGKTAGADSSKLTTLSQDLTNVASQAITAREK